MNIKPKLWTKDYLLNAVVTVLIMFLYYQITSIIALFSMENLEATPSQGGFAAGILIVAALVARIFTGMAIDRQGHRKMLFFGLAIHTVAMGLYFIVTNIPVLVVIRLLHGAGFGIATTATITGVAHIIPESRRGEGIGYFMMSVTIATATGPSLGIYLYQNVDFTAILILNSIILVAAFLVAFLLRYPRIDSQEFENDGGKRFSLGNIFEVKVIPLALSGFLVFFAYSSIISFLSVYVKINNLVNAGSLFFVINSIATLISRPFVGKLFDSRGENFVIYPAFVLFGTGLFVLGISHTGWMLMISAAMMGIGFGAFVPGMQTVAIKMVDTHRMSLATTTNLAISEIGIGIGPFILGLMVPRFGYRGMYQALPVLVIVAMINYFYVHGKRL